MGISERRSSVIGTEEVGKEGVAAAKGEEANAGIVEVEECDELGRERRRVEICKGGSIGLYMEVKLRGEGGRKPG